MTCKKTAELLLDYLDGELNVELVAPFEKHVADCGPCRTFLNTYKRTTVLCKEALLAAVPAELENRLVSFLREKVSKQGSKSPSN